MTPEEAVSLLALSPGAEEREIRAAYARAVKADHPDHGGAGTLMAQLKEARRILLTQGEVPPCNLCRGVGKVRGRFGAQTCTACGGSGDRP